MLSATSIGGGERARADIGDRILEPVGAAPGELGIVPQSMPMAGLAVSGGLSLHLGRRDGGGGDPPWWTAGLRPMVSLSLWGALQIDAAIAVRADIVEGSWQSGAGPVRLGVRVPVPRLGRAAGETGAAVGLRFDAAFAVSRRDAEPQELAGGVVIDHRTRWTQIGLQLDVPVVWTPAQGGGRVDLDLGLGGRIALCAACGASLVIGTRWRFPVRGPGAAASDWDGRLAAGLTLEVTRGVELEALAGVRAPGAPGPNDWGRLAYSGSLTLRFWASTRPQALAPASLPDRAGLIGPEEIAATPRRLHVPAPDLLAQTADIRAADGHPRLTIDPMEAVRDAGEAIALANRRYLEPALARRGLQALHETIAGTAMGVVVTAAFMGATLYVGASVQITMIILRALGLTSLVMFGAERMQEIAGVFDRFLATAAQAHGEKEWIDRAAHQYADAVALITGAAAEAIVFLALARETDEVLKDLEGTRFAEKLGIPYLRTWINERLRRLGRTPGATANGTAAPKATRPATAAAGGSSPATRSTAAPKLTPHQKGQLGQDWSRQAIQARGETIAGEDVDLIFTIRGRRVAIRADFLVEDPMSGLYTYIESKYSGRASYTPNQRAVIPELVKAGDAGLPAVVGSRARSGRLFPGRSIRVRFQGDIWNAKPSLVGE